MYTGEGFRSLRGNRNRISKMLAERRKHLACPKLMYDDEEAELLSSLYSLKNSIYCKKHEE